ncbi:MAG: hypothetical protein N4A49_12535 [Marinifilaceae bacterium]|jgi:hypothetical protein|nr:hypothetical protein [Marinifilaceae bacterium]
MANIHDNNIDGKKKFDRLKDKDNELKLTGKKRKLGDILEEEESGSLTNKRSKANLSQDPNYSEDNKIDYFANNQINNIINENKRRKIQTKDNKSNEDKNTASKSENELDTNKNNKSEQQNNRKRESSDTNKDFDLFKKLTEENNEGVNEKVNQGSNEEVNEKINEGVNEEVNQGSNEEVKEGVKEEVDQGSNEGENEKVNEGVNEESKKTYHRDDYIINKQTSFLDYQISIFKQCIDWPDNIYNYNNSQKDKLNKLKKGNLSDDEIREMAKKDDKPLEGLGGENEKLTDAKIKQELENMDPEVRNNFNENLERLKNISNEEKAKNKNGKINRNPPNNEKGGKENSLSKLFNNNKDNINTEENPLSPLFNNKKKSNGSEKGKGEKEGNPLNGLLNDKDTNNTEKNPLDNFFNKKEESNSNSLNKHLGRQINQKEEEKIDDDDEKKKKKKKEEEEKQKKLNELLKNNRKS